MLNRRPFLWPVGGSLVIIFGNPNSSCMSEPSPSLFFLPFYLPPRQHVSSFDKYKLLLFRCPNRFWSDIHLPSDDWCGDLHTYSLPIADADRLRSAIELGISSVACLLFSTPSVLGSYPCVYDRLRSEVSHVLLPFTFPPSPDFSVYKQAYPHTSFCPFFFGAAPLPIPRFEQKRLCALCSIPGKGLQS